MAENFPRKTVQRNAGCGVYPRSILKYSMKHSFKLIALSLTLALAGAPLIHAQSAEQKPARERGPGGPGGPGGGGRGGPNIEMLTEQLSLTADQKTKLEPILKAQGQKMQDLRKDESLSQEQRREKSRSLREAGQKEIEAVLTPEQIKKFEEMRQRGGGPRGERGGDKGEKPAKN